jgi:hypothetical protein
MYCPGSDPNSIDDVDLMGFVIPDARYYLGLSEWGSRGTKEYKEGKWDCVFYEIRKAVSLLLQGNPNIMSMLWLRPEDRLMKDWPIGTLFEHRDAFVGKHVYNAFAGYAHAQLEKMESRDPAQLREYIAVTNELKYRGSHPNHKGEVFPRPVPFPNASDGAIDGGDLACMVAANERCMTGEEKNAYNTSVDKLLAKLASYHKKGENIGYMGDKRKQLVVQHGYDAKNAAHCIRLLKMCIEFLDTGTMTVYRIHDREQLLSIKKGEWSLEQVKQYATDLFNDAKAARDRSTLPEKPDRDRIERVLVSILTEYVEVMG